MVVMKKFAFRVSKIFGFIIIMLVVVRAMPEPENYIDYEFASRLCDFIYGDKNAETMFDTYTDTGMLIILTITTVIYILTMKLFKKIMSK